VFDPDCLAMLRHMAIADELGGQMPFRTRSQEPAYRNGQELLGFIEDLRRLPERRGARLQRSRARRHRTLFTRNDARTLSGLDPL
jgi:hypothetical protein